MKRVDAADRFAANLAEFVDRADFCLFANVSQFDDSGERAAALGAFAASRRPPVPGVAAIPPPRPDQHRWDESAERQKGGKSVAGQPTARCGDKGRCRPTLSRSSLASHLFVDQVAPPAPAGGQGPLRGVGRAVA